MKNGLSTHFQYKEIKRKQVFIHLLKKHTYIIRCRSSYFVLKEFLIFFSHFSLVLIHLTFRAFIIAKFYKWTLTVNAIYLTLTHFLAKMQSFDNGWRITDEKRSQSEVGYY